MSTKFVNKLKRDLKKSPGKAAVLALLLAVAVWFWSPLIVNLMGGSSTSPPATSNVATTATPTDATKPTESQASNEPKYTWKQIADAIEKDPRMTPATTRALPKDPFRGVTAEKPKEIAEAPPVVVPEVLDVAPANAGLVLTSTIVGPTRKVARLNGKTYREGDMIPATLEDKTIQYKVLSIGAKSIRLSLGEIEYEMKMLRRGAQAATATVGVSSDSPDFDPSVLE